MNQMFATTDFNGDSSKWNVSKVTDMSDMFWDALLFNGDISKWNVFSVTNMADMFLGAKSFQGNVLK